ncbi:ornithine carbamoyltransferase [Pirellula staleyi DSM 6068]|uniref:Ornithine carbamoyltransferase n=1 Tax=Pirellula staleyi (strain ATCC 27377 / DSM 6068 / ICPB 4128) TaxID=530564 RepID=D2R6P8_PIRSD|nr:ornithine carbamoyltransferase [Pirellula staleyi]ADB17348.1 ornithine carbamoyltransferase [Pirellula staleyi DSM 6068]
MRHVLTLLELSTEEIERVFAISRDLKAKLAAGVREPLLPGRIMAMLFEKQSLRTRVSFETAIGHLGGNSMFLGQDVGWGKRESAADFSQVLSQYVDVIVCRTTAHARIEELAKYCTVPVINGLTDSAHPCQALADVFTLVEIHGDLTGKRVAYVGDANNVAKSLAICCGKLGIEFSIAAPKGYEFDDEFRQTLKAAAPNMKLLESRDPKEVVKGAVGVYTDVWVSMGQEAEQDERRRAFADYQVNEALMKVAPKNASFLHCLPARRGEEVTDGVIDSPQSAVIPQAGNRMHVQKGLIAWLLNAKV